MLSTEIISPLCLRMNLWSGGWGGVRESGKIMLKRDVLQGYDVILGLLKLVIVLKMLIYYIQGNSLRSFPVLAKCCFVPIEESPKVLPRTRETQFRSYKENLLRSFPVLTKCYFFLNRQLMLVTIATPHRRFRPAKL